MSLRNSGDLFVDYAAAIRRHHAPPKLRAGLIKRKNASRVFLYDNAQPALDDFGLFYVATMTQSLHAVANFAERGCRDKRTNAAAK